ncbi:MAG: Lrp/AsnC family transcriptional regulator [Methylobacteriaceae bacterium]|nr:Lrp/AsnC family transcriptional regulator [Methylobacteriaceae bacterium]
MTGRLDAIDLAILDELQADGRMTNVELARRVGISAPPCLRRVRALEEDGVIAGYRALVETRAVGLSVVFFVFVKLDQQTETELAAFGARVADWKIVRECWTVSGETDFILKCVAPDLDAFQSFVTELTGAPNVRNVRSSLAMKAVKDEPLAYVDRAAGHGNATHAH